MDETYSEYHATFFFRSESQFMKYTHEVDTLKSDRRNNDEWISSYTFE